MVLGLLCSMNHHWIRNNHRPRPAELCQAAASMRARLHVLGDRGGTVTTLFRIIINDIILTSFLRMVCIFRDQSSLARHSK